MKLPRTLITAAGLSAPATGSQTGPTLGVQEAYRPETENKKKFLNDIGRAFGTIEGLERDLDTLDIGEGVYRTLMPMVEEMKRAAQRLRSTYQEKVYRRPNIDRDIDARANVQRSPRRR